MIQSLLNWLYGYKLFRRTASIYDLKFKDLLLGTYQQKLPSKRLAPLFPENQYSLGVCSFESTANDLAIYFGEEVSVKWLVAKAFQQGYCSKGGGATVEMGAKVARKFGVVFEKDLPSYEDQGWDNFINVDFAKFDVLASQQKIGSYYFLDTPQEILQSIDLGYGVIMGRDFQVPIPFTAPWVINRTGTTVEPHSTLVVGYREALFDMLNSWGTDFGDKGFFYLSQGDVQQDIDDYGAVAITPIAYTPKDIKIKSLLELLKQIKDKIMNILSASNLLWGTAYNCLGENLVPSQPHNACAMYFSVVNNKAFPEDKINFTNCQQCHDWLKSSPKWQEIDSPQTGAVILTDIRELPAGSPINDEHIGIVGKHNAPDGTLNTMSFNGTVTPPKWDSHLSVRDWEKYWVDVGHGKIHYYQRLVV